MAHPEAFVRMVRLILEHDLVRFSSVVRAADVWFGLNWDAASGGKIREVLEKALVYLTDQGSRDRALEGSGTAEEAYLALWACAFYDVHEAVGRVGPLLRHADVGCRFAAMLMLWRFGTYNAVDAGLAAFEDEDIRPISIAVGMLADGVLEDQREEHFRLPGRCVPEVSGQVDQTEGAAVAVAGVNGGSGRRG